MKKSLRVIFVIFFCYLPIITTIAQDTEISKTKTDILKNKSSGSNKGIQTTQNELQIEIDNMIKQGMTPEQIQLEIAKKKQERKSDTKNPKQGDPESKIKQSGKDKQKQEEEQEEEEETEKKKPKKFPITKGDIEYAVYGQNIFASGASPFEPQDYQNPPDDYVVGPGDEINVVVWGDSEANDNHKVALDGTIFPEKVGRLVVNGMKFKTMREFVKSQYRKIYASPNTNIEVSISKVRSIRVNIVGEVMQPGAYTISALSTAFNAIYASGGPNSIGSLRTIYVKRNGKTIDTLDIYQYLLNADFGKQIYLQHNDIIQVPVAKKIVELTGEVKRPLAYELKENEGLFELIQISGGFLHTAYKKNIQIKRIQNYKEILIDVDYDEKLSKNENVPLLDGDIIEVRRVREGVMNSVQAVGAFNQTGFFQLPPTSKLGDLLKKTEGLTADAYLSRAYILRINNDLDVDYIPIDLTGLSDTIGKGAEEVKNIQLMPFDIVRVFSKKEFKDSNYVEIKGLVRKEGKYPITGKITLKDVLYFAGGLKEEAANTKIEVSRILKQKSANESRITRVTVLTVNVKPDLSIDQEAEKFIMSPYDQVFVRKNPDFNMQESVFITGQVLYPGEYTKLERTERLSSLIERAGGIREKEAYLDGATLFRKMNDSTTQRIAINLKKALKKPNSKYDIVLREGDVIHIPLLQDFVNVQGAVQTNVTVTFDGKTKYKHYIALAGGFKDNVKRSKCYITYANGMNQPTRNYILFKKYPKVEPGATLVAVPKTESNATVLMARTQIAVGLITGFTTLMVALLSAINLFRQ
ncbi:MAG: SLBB domain-containing protein [Bacteroidia bacterium]|nr:SLBB domain-containing protein [Bacteroidia bacterium]MDW8301788.1 SLBB domain-containing protein [Bacteroidia bacterium]